MARIPVLEPDVVVLDVRLPDGDGVTVCRDIRSMLPDTRMLMLTSYSDDEALYGAVMAGASGYILKQIQDRKSTRLNSSHVSISYAVFCLKKKKNTYNIIQY